MIDKSEFDACEALITECRKDGHLPLNIIAEDEGRAFKNDEFIHEANPKKVAKSRVNYLLKKWDYTPISFWENQDYYVQMLVEKLGLRNLFSPICATVHLRIASGSGWSDLNSRADIMRHFKEWEEKGKIPILLYCGDHDPAGFNISETLKKNIEDISKAVEWEPDNLRIDRFGLNHDLINSLGLTWIDYLITGSKKKLKDGGLPDLSNPLHPDYLKRYVQNYKKMMLDHGEDTWIKKCEAEAIFKTPETRRAAEKLCSDAILKYIPYKSINIYNRKIKSERKELVNQIKIRFKKIIAKKERR